MATLYVRDVPDSIYEAVQALATAHHQSVNAYVNDLLKTKIEQEQANAIARKALRQLHALREALPANSVDTTELLRQLRNNPRS